MVQSFRANLALPIVLNGGSTVLLLALKDSLLDVIQRERSAETAGGEVNALHALMLKASICQRIDEDRAASR